MNVRRGMVAAGLVVCVAAGGCSSRSEADNPPSPAAKTETPAAAETATTAGGAPAAPPVTVTVAPVAVRNVERTVAVVGTLAANEQADLASESEGQVIAVSADLGDRVKAGQVLAKVRGDAIEARVREAEASYDKAVADEARGRPLSAQGIISVQEYQQVATSLQVAKARRDALRVELDRTNIRAPFDGSVAQRMVSVGNYVRSGTPIFRLVQDDPLKFRGEIPERETPNVVAEQPIRVSVDAYRGETFNGTVKRVGAAADPTARSVAFEAIVPNGDHRLRPGFFGHGDIVVRHDERALAVPRSAIVTFAGVTKVFVVDGDLAREHEVALGVDLGDGWVEVAQGVTRGAAVVTTGLSKLVDGSRVVVRESEAGA